MSEFSNHLRRQLSLAKAANPPRKRQPRKSIQILPQKIKPMLLKKQLTRTSTAWNQPPAASSVSTSEKSQNIYQLGFNHFKDKFQELDSRIALQKNLVNMIIHDLRSPTSQIKHAAGTITASIEYLLTLIDELAGVIEEDRVLLDNLTETLVSLQPTLGERASTEWDAEQKVEAGGSGSDFLPLISCLETSIPRLADNNASETAKALLSKVRRLNKPKQTRAVSTEPRLRSSTHLSPFVQSSAANQHFKLELNFADEQPERRHLSSIASIQSESSEEANASLDSESSSSLHSKSFIANWNQLDQRTPKLFDQVASRNKGSSFTQQNLTMQSALDFSSPLKDRNSSSMTLPDFQQQHQAPPLVDQQAVADIREAISSLQQNFEVAEVILGCAQDEMSGLSKMNSSCEYSSAVLLNLINDLMDLAKTENNAFSICKDFFNLDQALKEADSTLSFMAEQKQITTNVEVTLDPEARMESVFGDSGRLKQVIVNLMSNALKFTDEGGRVDLRAHIEQYQQEGPELEKLTNKLEGEEPEKISGVPVGSCLIRIDVQDNGQGISKEGQTKLFTNYASLGEHKARNQRGTGLGLCICKQIIEKMDGSIKVESTQGEGTTFKLTIPFIFKKANTSDFTSSIVTSSDASCMSSRSLPFNELAPLQKSPLQNLSLSSHSKAQGREVKSMQHFSLGKRQMSVKNFGIRSQISKLPHNLPKRQQSHQFKLATRLKEGSPPNLDPASNKRLTTLLSARHNPTEKWRQLRVLVVNDEPVSLMILEGMFRDQLGFAAVKTAQNGKQAVEAAEKETYDLILMDLNMPVLDGTEATIQIRRGHLNSKAVIVALSASSYTDDLAKQCREAGFTKWLTAPVSLEDMTKSVLEAHFD